MSERTCERCYRVKPWYSGKLCPRCYAVKREARNALKVVASVGPSKVTVVNSNQVITFRTRHDKIWRTALAHTRHCQSKKTGELTKYWNLIWINPRRSHYWTAENIPQTLSCESIHLALFSLGLGKENIQLDKTGLHTWTDIETQVAEYEGLSIKKYGLKKDD